MFFFVTYGASASDSLATRLRIRFEPWALHLYPNIFFVESEGCLNQLVSATLPYVFTRLPFDLTKYLYLRVIKDAMSVL